MSNVKVFRLAYADFASEKPDELIKYYTETMGFKLIDTGEDGSAYLSNGLDHHNMVVTPSSYRGIRRYGYQLNGELPLEDVQKQLKDQGIKSSFLTDAKPGIKELLEVEDPSGNILELFTDMDQPAQGFGNSGIVPLKLGHIAFYSRNHKQTIQFYQDSLGFTFTDKIGEDFANFLTCNQDHHVLNIVASPNKSKLHHIAFQLKDAAHQYASSDILASHGYTIAWGPSRHTAGHNIATYHHDADGNVVELFIDMDTYIPELGIYEPRPWHKELPLKPKSWEGLSSWGTEFDFDLADI